MAYTVMAFTVTAYVVLAYTVMAFIAMAYILMADIGCDESRRALVPPAAILRASTTWPRCEERRSILNSPAGGSNERIGGREKCLMISHCRIHRGGGDGGSASGSGD